ncbi:MAG: hypothetical protein NTZ92_05850 [Candidatus Omnitrophica bacterium]|nr:hypothetical protein [Candidatus Omnitrophota bacterium]
MKANLYLMNKNGQAAAELAILGVLIITAFSFIMNFGQSLGAQQQTKMESFRRALQKAYIRNASVSNTLKKTVNVASVNAGFFQGQGLSPESSSSVTWQKGKPGDQGSLRQSSFAFWRINNTDVSASNDTDDAMTGSSADYGLPLNYQYTYSADGSQSDYMMLIPASAYKENTTRTETYAFSGNKIESNPSIRYEKTVNLEDSSSGTVYTHFNTATDEDPGDDTPETPEYEEAASIPYDSSISYAYDSDWTVPHGTGSGTGSTTVWPKTITTMGEWEALFGPTMQDMLIWSKVRDCINAGDSFVITDSVNGDGYCNAG